MFFRFFEDKDQQDVAKHLLEPSRSGASFSEAESSTASGPISPVIPLLTRVSWEAKMADVFFMLGSETSKEEASENRLKAKKHVLTGLAYLAVPMPGKEEEAQNVKWISNYLSMCCCDSPANKKLQVGFLIAEGL